MKLKKSIELLMCILWLGLALLTVAVGPPPPTGTPPASEVEPSGQPPVTAVLDLTSAIALPQTETASEPMITSTASLTLAMVMAEYDGREVNLLAEAEVAALSGARAPANTTIIRFEPIRGVTC